MNATLTFLLLGWLVTAHEYGHLLAARLAGVPVARFAVGFGPRLWGFRRGATEYVLCAFPVGGYVMPDVADEREFFGISPARRIAFALGGPLMNLVLGVGLLVVAAVANGGASLRVVVSAVGSSFETLAGMLAALGALFEEPAALSGVVGIVAEGAQWTAAGPVAMLSFGGLLSLNLALVNLLPLPPLDGGKVALSLLEYAYRGAARLHAPMSVGGAVLLLGVFIYVSALDVVRLAA